MTVYARGAVLAVLRQRRWSKADALAAIREAGDAYSSGMPKRSLGRSCIRHRNGPRGLGRGTNCDPAEPKRDLNQSPAAKARSGDLR
jgi:hypothetical protein